MAHSADLPLTPSAASCGNDSLVVGPAGGRLRRPSSAGADLLGRTYRPRLRTSSQKLAQISRTVSDCHRTTASAIRPATTRRRSQGQAPLGLSPLWRSCGSLRDPLACSWVGCRRGQRGGALLDAGGSCCRKPAAGTACGASPGPRWLPRPAGLVLAGKPAAPRQSQMSWSRSTPGGPAQPHRRSAARPATATGSPRTRTHPRDPGR